MPLSKVRIGTLPLSGMICSTAVMGTFVATAGGQSVITDSASAARQGGPMSGWVERSAGNCSSQGQIQPCFTAFLPNRLWQMVASQNGTDISSPTGVADVSFAYATEDPSPSSDPAVLQFTLRELGFSGVRVLRQSAQIAYAGSERQVTQLVGVQKGVAKRAILSVEVFNNYSTDSFGFDVNLQMAPVSLWVRYEPALALIADHIYFYGYVPAEIAPGHCGVDPSDTGSC